MAVEVSIIIPTTAEASRKNGLFKAIDCILNQKNVKALPIVVLNGNIYDDEVRKNLENRQDISFIYQIRGSLPAAIVTGRSLVTTQYFGFLDDDDEYTQDALATRLAPFRNDSSLDIVVTNGLRCSKEGDVVAYEKFSEFAADPLSTLLDNGNWLASCGGLFRTDSVSIDFFDSEQKYFEWTFTAFKLALASKKIEFVDKSTFKINSSENSLSKNINCDFEEVLFLKKLQKYKINEKICRRLDVKLADSYHSAARSSLELFNFRNSLRYYAKSIMSIYGVRKYSKFIVRIFINVVFHNNFREK